MLGGYEVSVIRTYGADFVDAVESVTIPSTVKEIGSRSFYGAVNLSEVNFASGCQVETFGEHCFEGCFGLTEFTMPASLKTCEDAPFYGCVNLKRLVFNDDVEPFLYTSLTISGDDAFEIARHFNPAPYAEGVEFVVPSSSKHYKVVDGSLMSKDGTILYAHPSTPAGGTLIVSGSVKVLGWMSLFSNEGITHIELPSGLERIEDYALAYTGIDELTMPDSVVEVQGSICYECPNLKRVVISDSLKELGQQAGWNCFYGCENLDDVTLGSSLEVIGNGCFAYSKIESIHIPASVKQINYAAFAACSELSQVTGCTGLEQLNRMSFAQDGKLTSFPLDASDGYRYISSEAFSDTPYQPTKPSYMDVSDSGDFVVYDASLVFEGDVLYSEAYQVLNLVNSERAKEGLPVLTMDRELLAAANQRAAELCVLFDHTRPSGDDCFTVSDKAMGENIAAYQVDAEAVMDSWMNSSGHRNNIMSDRWSSIGIAAFKQNGAVYWVQLFGEDEAQTAAQPADVHGSYTVRVMDETCKLDMRVLYVDIEDGSNIYDDGLDVGERGRVGLAVVQNGRFARVSDSCISWSSSDSSVASIDGDGIVTAHKPGIATMTAKADKGSGFYMRTYDITVLQPSEPDPDPDPGTDPDAPAPVPVSFTDVTDSTDHAPPHPMARRGGDLQGMGQRGRHLPLRALPERRPRRHGGLPLPAGGKPRLRALRGRPRGVLGRGRVHVSLQRGALARLGRHLRGMGRWRRGPRVPPLRRDSPYRHGGVPAPARGLDGRPRARKRRQVIPRCDGGYGPRRGRRLALRRGRHDGLPGREVQALRHHRALRHGRNAAPARRPREGLRGGVAVGWMAKVLFEMG